MELPSCTDPNCRGKLDSRKKINIHDYLPNALISVVPHAVPCSICGRLHWLNGEIVKETHQDTLSIMYFTGDKITGRVQL